ncbi:MAG: (Fe-S)-binding protein [Lentimicrobiaceae bacterium]|nr:(Fe-S)-binding protein [Lentimicrobiaceae bacterium]
MFFHPFILPFCVGVVALFVILFIKYTRWISQLNKVQFRAFRRNIFSWRVFAATWEAIREGLLHFRIFKHNVVLGFMHSTIAIGWLLMIVVSKFEADLYCGSIVSRPWMGIFFRFFEAQNGVRDFKGANLFTNAMDAILLMVLLGVCLAFCKRLYSRLFGMKKMTKHAIFDQFTLYAMWAIFPLRFLAESCTAAWARNGGFLTQTVGDWLNPNYAHQYEFVFWWAYSLSLFVFLVAMPFSRYMHIFTEIWLIFFRNLRLKETKKTSGYTKFELSACSRCGICIDGCPLNSELGNSRIQPVYFLRDIRYKRDVTDIANDCLMCHRCVSDCPVLIESVEIRRQKRDKKELDTQGNYPFIENIHPFNAIGRVVYFAGCMSHLTPSIPQSMRKIFDAAGQKYWFMDEDRTVCCGRPLWQQGFTNQAEDLIQKNTELIQKSGARMLITSCPICYISFKNEYSLPHIEIFHHSEYIDRLLKKNRIKVSKQDLDVVFHDPCELGRGTKIYKAPRNVLKAVANLKKARYEKEKAICCGYNLGNTVITSEEQRKIRDASMRNLLTTNAKTICTACPMCKKSFTHATTQSVKDIAELVAENLAK